MKDIKKKLWTIPDSRNDFDFEDMELGWITDFENVNSVANVALRKTDLQNFANSNEGDLFNNLFFKVRGNNYIKLIWSMSNE